MTNPAEKKLLYCKKCGDTVRKWFDRQVLTGYFCNNCGMQQDFRYKDTAAEKIRQVKESAMAIKFMTKEQIIDYCLANTLETIWLGVLKIHDARREPGAIPMTVYAEQNVGYFDAIADVENMVKEARSSLDSGCTSITNSTHE